MKVIHTAEKKKKKKKRSCRFYTTKYQGDVLRLMHMVSFPGEMITR